MCHSLQLLTIDITDQYYGCSLSHFQAGNAGNTSLVVAAVAATNGHGKTRRTCGSITYREDVGFLSILTRRPSWGAKIENYKAKEH